jgi:hypothetical protein
MRRCGLGRIAVQRMAATRIRRNGNTNGNKKRHPFNRMPFLFAATLCDLYTGFSSPRGSIGATAPTPSASSTVPVVGVLFLGYDATVIMYRAVQRYNAMVKPEDRLG